MPFDPSLNPDITEAFPFLLTARETSAAATARGCMFDIDISGIGFRLGANGQNPFDVRTVQIQKQQFDSSKEPGEQTLDGFWTRSQNSWHKGSGITFYDPGTDDATSFRFADSSGVDVWTQGKIRPSGQLTVNYAQTGDCWVYRLSDGNVVYANNTGLLTGGFSTTLPSYTSGGASYAYRPYVLPSGVVIQVGTGGVFNATTNAAIATRTTDSTTAGRLGVWWVKSRLIVALYNKLFEVPLSGTAVDMNSATPLYVHSSTNFTWVDVVETPSSILALGNDGTTGLGYRFSLQDATSGSTPKLSQGYQVLTLPTNEAIVGAASYLGRYVGLLTSPQNRTCSIRVAALDSNDNPVVGAALASFSGTGSVVYGFGDFLYFGSDAGIYAVNLGEAVDVDRLQFAWAKMQSSPFAAPLVPSSLAFRGTALVASYPTAGFYTPSTTAVAITPPFLKTGRVRLGTSVPKVFTRLVLTGSTDGPVTVTVTAENNVTLGRFRMDASTGIVGFGLDSSVSVEWVEVRFDFTDNTNFTIESMQLTALPKPATRQWLYTYPLHLRDVDTDRNGQPFGTKGYAYTRLRALVDLQDDQAVVNVTDRRTGESFVGIIQDMAYAATVNPEQGADNFGGLLQVQVRKL